MAKKKTDPKLTPEQAEKAAAKQAAKADHAKQVKERAALVRAKSPSLTGTPDEQVALLYDPHTHTPVLETTGDDETTDVSDAD